MTSGKPIADTPDLRTAADVLGAAKAAASRRLIAYSAARYSRIPDAWTVTTTRQQWADAAQAVLDAGIGYRTAQDTEMLAKFGEP